MSFFNRIAGLFKRAKTPVVQNIPAPQMRTLGDYAQDLLRASFTPSIRLIATHRTSSRTVSMDLRDAKRRRNIEKKQTKKLSL